MKKKLRGSSVIEMSLIMPVVLLTWVVVIYALFYYYDKNILSAAAYETATVGSEMYRESEKVDAARLQSYYQDRVAGKLLFFQNVSCEVSEDNRVIVVKVATSSGRMSINLERRSALLIPEKEIRRVKALIKFPEEEGQNGNETGI